MNSAVSNRVKSQIIALYLQGFSRDEIAIKVGKSGGFVSKVIKEFTDCADSSSTEKAAQEYGVAETVENLRNLAVTIKKSGTSVEKLLDYSETLEKIKKNVPADKLEEFIKASESIGDREHVGASLKMFEIEERTGKQHDEILRDVESKEARVATVSRDIQRLNAEKTRLETEVQNKQTQHGLTVEKIDEISKIKQDLAAHGIDLTQLQQVRNLLNFVRESCEDPRKLVELAKTTESLRGQVQTQTAKLATIESKANRLNARLGKARLVMRKYLILKAMGWTDQSLENAIKLTKAAGKVEEVLCRLELLKSSAEAKAECDRIKIESEALKKQDTRILKRISRKFTKLEKQAANLVNDRIPSILSETETFLENQTDILVSQYNSLADKHSKLKAEYDKAVAEFAKCQKWLDDAVCWTTLLQAPERLSANAVSRILFETLFPKLEAWGINKTLKERLEIAQQMFLNAMTFYNTSTANVIRTPKEVNIVDLRVALMSFSTVIFPFYRSFEISYDFNKTKDGAQKLFDAKYYLDKFFTEGIQKL